jgi:hypothetical protein
MAWTVKPVPLTKDEDNELKKLAAIFAYAANQSTPGTAKEQEDRIYNMVHGVKDCAHLLKNICDGTGKFERLYFNREEANVDGNGVTNTRFIKAIFSPNRDVVPLSPGVQIQLIPLSKRILSGDYTDLVPRKWISENTYDFPP